MAAALTLIAGSSNLVTLSGLTNSVSSAYENSASVTMRLTTMQDVAVSGESWPVTLAPTTESPRTGKYQAVLSHNLAIVAGQTYKYTITAQTGGGSPITAQRTWSGTLVAISDRN